MPRVLLLAVLASACAARAPRLDYRTLDSAAEARPMTYGTWTPSGWDGVTPLPLVVFLHGGGDDERAWDDHPVSWRTLDAHVADGRIPPFVMVVPDGDRGFWRNWHDGSHRYADWVLDEVVADAYARFPLIPPEEGGLHLMGISMGGVGTLYMGLDHLDRFASLTVLSAPLFRPDEALRFLERDHMPFMGAFQRVFGPPERDRVVAQSAYTRLRGEADLRGTRLIVGHGTVDIAGVGPSTRAFRDHLVAHGVPHTYLAYRGGHLWRDWSRVYPLALCLNLGGTDCDARGAGLAALEVHPSDAVAAP